MKLLHHCVDDSWEVVCRKVNRAVVFIDDACAECLHWFGGLGRLLAAGAVDVKEFSSFEFAKPEQKKVVFIVSQPLFDVTTSIIHNIIESSNLQYVIAITTVSHTVHLFARTGALDGDHSAIFEQFEEKLLEWMGNMNYTAEVSHMPLDVASISPSLFVTPAFSDLFPLTNVDLKQIEVQYNAARLGKGEKVSLDRLDMVDNHYLPNDLRVFYKSFASTLNDLLTGLDVREEVFYVGHTSRLLATDLENLPAARARRKTSHHQASLILIDRTLDLAAPTSLQADTVLSKMVQVLPRLSRHKNDVAVDMSAFCTAHNSESMDVIAPGCLAQPNECHNYSLMNQITKAKLTDCLSEMVDQLQDAASSEDLPYQHITSSGHGSRQQLQMFVELFRGNDRAICNQCGILQVVMATLQAINHPGNRRLDNIVNMQKLIVQNSGNEEGQSPVHQVLQILETEMDKEENDRELSLDDILMLLVHVYSLIGEDILVYEADEKRLQRAFTDAVLQEQGRLPEITKEIFGDVFSEGVIQDIVADIWKKLRAIKDARLHLKQLGSILEPGTLVAPGSSTPFLQQLTELVFNPNKPDLIDVENRSSGLKDLFKTGFGFFKGPSKPRPADAKSVIIFVVGGVTSTEIRQIHNVLAAYKDSTQVLVGSTQLVRPADIVKHMFTQDKVNLLQQL